MEEAAGMRDRDREERWKFSIGISSFIYYERAMANPSHFRESGGEVITNSYNISYSAISTLTINMFPNYQKIFKNNVLGRSNKSSMYSIYNVMKNSQRYLHFVQFGLWVQHIEGMLDHPLCVLLHGSFLQ